MLYGTTLQLPLLCCIIGGQVGLLLLEAVWNQIWVRLPTLLLGVSHCYALMGM